MANHLEAVPGHALEAWAGAVGADHVLSDAATLARYGRSTLPQAHAPIGVVRPASTEEVAEIVRIAGLHGVPLYPISRGKNWGYGDACPSGPGQVVLDLARMDRIVEVDERLAYAVVEPGVTQGELAAHLRETGTRLWLDCTGAGPDASLIGNVVERGFGHSPYGNRIHTLSGLQVVLGDGQVIETGFGAHPNARAQRLYPYGVGPWLDGIFTQSNFGVVTRLGLWLMPEPEAFTLVVGILENHEDVAPVVDGLRRLRLDGTVRSVAHIGNDLRLISSGRPFPRDRAGAPPLSPELRRTLQREVGFGAWAFSGGLYGRREQVAAARRAVKRELAGPGRTLVFLDDRTLALGHRVAGLLGFTGWGRRTAEKLRRSRPLYDLHRGVPSGHFLAGAYWRHRDGLPPDFATNAEPARDQCGLLWIAPVIPATGEAALELDRLVAPIFARHGFDLLATLSTVTERALDAVLTIAYDKSDPDETARARDCAEAVVAAVLAAGFVPYRVGIPFMPQVMGNAPALAPALRAIKTALDPQGILAPGRYDPRS